MLSRRFLLFALRPLIPLSLGVVLIAAACAGGEPTPTASPVTPAATPADTPSIMNTLAPGTVFVTEIMANPLAVSDIAGEWFEVFNRSDGAVDINGWTIRDLVTNIHVIDNGAPIVVPPQGFLVLGRNADTASNGGVVVDYQYSGFFLDNSADEIEVVDSSGTVIDIVLYSSSLVFDGASITLSPVAFDAIANDQPRNWCPATSLMPGGDKGTPGVTNDSCP